MIPRARAGKLGWVAETIAVAFGVSIPRMRRWRTRRVAAGEVHVLEEAGERLGLIVQRAAADRL